jgi:hypothetical protein
MKFMDYMLALAFLVCLASGCYVAWAKASVVMWIGVFLIPSIGLVALAAGCALYYGRGDRAVQR